MTRYRTLAVSALGAMTLAVGAGASAAGSPAAQTPDNRPSPGAQLAMQVSSPALAACFPHAEAHVSVDLSTDKRGFDTVRVHAEHLRPNTTFTVFFLETAGAPFGAAEYLGDFTTNQYGEAHNSYRAIAEEAFAFDNVTHVRKDLNSVGFWFADPADDDECLGGGSPVTGFDGDASAGVQMMNSGTNVLP